MEETVSLRAIPSASPGAVIVTQNLGAPGKYPSIQQRRDKKKGRVNWARTLHLETPASARRRDRESRPDQYADETPVIARYFRRDRVSEDRPTFIECQPRWKRKRAARRLPVSFNPKKAPHALCGGGETKVRAAWFSFAVSEWRCGRCERAAEYRNPASMTGSAPGGIRLPIFQW